ncbi:MAG: hypothetical protein J6X66_04720 [Lachnospiraceae bacterium]|nr:hypothetical protein [Lachnospiraceae bacterium]
MKNVVIIILTTLGAILTVMSGHDLIFKNSQTWLTGIEGSSLTTVLIAGLVCLAAVGVILLVDASNHRLSSSVTAPQKAHREYYGPGADSFNGAYGDRTASGGDVHSMVSGAFARTVSVEPEPAPVQQRPMVSIPEPVQVPPRTNDAVDPIAFAHSAETPAGAAANMNPLYGGIVETKKADYVSPYAGVGGNVNYDPAYGGQPNTQNGQNG